MVLEPKDLAIVVELLEDQDPEIVGHICRKLYELGSKTVRQVLSEVALDSQAHKEASRVLRWQRSPKPEALLKTLLDEAVEDIDLPSSNVLAFDLSDGGRVLARPSGTEPKIKFYFEVRDDLGAHEALTLGEERAKTKLEALESDFLKTLGI